MTSEKDPGVPEPFFDDLAELYERFVQVMDNEGNPVRGWLRSQLTGGARLVDIGCGGGQNCMWLAERYDEVFGVDISKRMIEIAESKPRPANIHYENRGGLDVRPESDGRFDAVLAVNTVFHLGEPEAVLARLRELVAPGGKLVVVDVALPFIPASPEAATVDPSTMRSRYIFETAHTVYAMSGNAEAAIDSIRLMLHPRWVEMSESRSPLSRAEFRTRYTASLPGAVITDDVVPDLAMAVWHAPE
jgi:SAM-dependent methyltransferase